MATIGSWRRIGVVTASAAVALTLGGCEEANPASEAVNKASTQMEMLALGGGQKPLAEDRLRDGYSTVLTTLRPAEAGSAGSRRAAAASLAAQAELGLGSLALADALDTELACARREAEIRTLQNHWTSLKSLEASLLAFDPSGEIARLEEERVTRAAEVTVARQELAEAQAELDGMRSRIASLEEQARVKWREETEIRQSAVDMDEVTRASLIADATRLKRQGDALDRQASELRAELESREPALRDIEAEIDRLTTQSEQLSAAIQALQTERSQRVALAEETAAEASALASRIAEVVGQLDDLREAAPAAWQTVAEACDAAAGKAGAASGAASNLGQIQSGAAEQMRGDALVHQAGGCEAYASTMRLLAQTEPALPRTEAYAAAAAAAEQKAAELRSLAETAYGQAADAFEALGGEGDRVERAMQQLGGTLREKAGTPAAPAEETWEEPVEDGEAAG